MSTKSKPIKIGITGQNCADGMGDLGHILNVGQALSRYKVTEVTYHIIWPLVRSKENQEISPNNIDVIRLNQLVDKLKYLHIIPEDHEVTGKTINEFINDINKAANGKFEIIGTDKQKKISSEGQDLWVSVSSGDFIGQHKEKYLDYVKFISIHEHDINEHYDIDEHGFDDEEDSFNDEHPFGNEGFFNDEGSFDDEGDKSYNMGIPLQPLTHDVGIMLSDHIDRTIQDRVKALQQIHHPKFQQLLREGAKDINDLENIIKTTEFIPVYPQHIDENYANNIIIECITKVDKEKQVFMKLGGTYNLDSLISNKSNLEKLKNSGFSSIEYFKDDKIENIEIPQPANTPQRSLKLLTKSYLSEKENTQFAELTGRISICSGDNTLQDAISHGSIPIFIPNMKGKEKVLSNLEEFLYEKNFPNSAKYVHTYKNNELFWTSKPKFNNHRAIEVCDEITPELLQEWPKACKEIVENFNLNKILSMYLDRLESTSEFRTAGDLLVKYLDAASNGSNLNIQHPELTEYDLRSIKQPTILSEAEIIDAMQNGEKINGDDPIDYAEYYNIKLEGKSPLNYAIEHNIKIGYENPVVYAQNELEKSKDHKFYIKDPQDGIEKSPIQYAIDNNIKLGDRNNQDPAIYAIENKHFFNNNGTEINNKSAIAEYAIKTRSIEDNKELIKYVIDHSIKIQNKDPIVYLQEEGKEFYIDDDDGNLMSPIKYAIVNDIKISKEYEPQIKQDVIQEIETIFEENGKALSEKEKTKILGTIFESHEDL